MSPRFPIAALLLALALPGSSIAAPDESSVALADFMARQAELQRLSSQAFAQMPLPRASSDKAAEKPCGDSDGDGLSDCVETGTGQYRSVADTGTSPTSPDTD